MKSKDFRNQIVIPALHTAGLWSKSSENLLVGTAMCESGLNSMIQEPSHIAASWFQIENATYQDCLRYLNRYESQLIKERILSACYLFSFPQDYAVMVFNIRLATLIARIKYYMQPEPLPHADDSLGIYKYYKVYYNSNLGSAKEDRDLPIFKEACSESV